MGTENPNRPNFPLRPAATPFAAQQSTTPFLSSGPVAGSEASAFRPAPPSNLQPPPFSGGPFVGSDPPAFRPPPSSRSNELVRPPPPSSTYGPPSPGFQRFPNPQMVSSGQVPPARPLFSGQPVIPPPIRPPPGPNSLLSQQPPPSVPMGPPQSIKTGQSYTNFPSSGPSSQPSSPQLGASYAVAGSTFPGYANMQLNSVPQAPPMPPASFPPQQGGYAPPIQTGSFPLHQGGYAPAAPILGQQRGYAPGQPMTTPGIYTGNQMQPHGHAPPIGGPQGLAEDFSSLSLGSAPGSFDAGLDTAALPRPLDGDVEPKSFAEMYPMNCSSRFLRLTTSGVPNSQSLASRWHLPLGAVVCPLAEAPVGVSLLHLFTFSTTSLICSNCQLFFI